MRWLLDLPLLLRSRWCVRTLGALGSPRRTANRRFDHSAGVVSKPWVSRQPVTLPPMALGQYRSAVAGRHYDDIDPNLLRALPNPGGAMELKHKAPEVTFLGARDQPDFGTLYVTFYPGEKVIELRSLKEYLYQWRDTAVSYERFLDVVFGHLMGVYEPVRLRLVFETRPRGGISSKLTIDSDWSIRGGKEQFRDWGGPDTW